MWMEEKKLEVSQENSMRKVMLSSEGRFAIGPQAEAYLRKAEDMRGSDLITSVVLRPHSCSDALLPSTSSVTPIHGHLGLPGMLATGYSP